MENPKVGIFSTHVMKFNTFPREMLSPHLPVQNMFNIFNQSYLSIIEIYVLLLFLHNCAVYYDSSIHQTLFIFSCKKYIGFKKNREKERETDRDLLTLNYLFAGRRLYLPAVANTQLVFGVEGVATSVFGRLSGAVGRSLPGVVYQDSFPFQTMYKTKDISMYLCYKNFTGKLYMQTELNMTQNE